MERSSRQEVRKTGINFLIRRVIEIQRESKGSDCSQTRVINNSPDLSQKPHKKQYQPRQRNSRIRTDSIDVISLSDLDFNNTGFVNSTSLIQEINLKSPEKASLTYASLSPKNRKQQKGGNRKLSPYANMQKFFTVGEKTYKPLPRMKDKQKVDIAALQNIFFEFQEKSKILLKQLERNVLGQR